MCAPGCDTSTHPKKADVTLGRATKRYYVRGYLDQCSACAPPSARSGPRLVRDVLSPSDLPPGSRDGNSRDVYNACKADVGQLKKGETYTQLADVVAVSICDVALWPDAEQDEQKLPRVPAYRRVSDEIQQTRDIVTRGPATGSSISSSAAPP